MRNRFDHLGRTIGLSALASSGRTVPEHLIAPDARRADLRHEPDPTRAAERARLGLLGRLVSVVCLLELYSDAPDEDDALACIGKLIAFRQHRLRDQRKKRARLRKRGRVRAAQPHVRPLCWILSAGCPMTVLAGLGAVRAAGWPKGVYFSPGILAGPGRGPVLAGLEGAGGLLRTGIVVASELPRDRSTLLVRFMAAGRLLPDAIADLAALPEDALERAVAEQILVDLQHALGSKSSPTQEEEEFIVSMQGTWADARKLGRDEGRDAGLKEGRDAGLKEEAARSLLTVLRARGFAVPDAMRERILAEKDLGTARALARAGRRRRLARRRLRRRELTRPRPPASPPARTRRPRA